MDFIETPVKKINTRAPGRKEGKKMPSKKQETPTATYKKAYAPSRMEVAKTVVIAVLITAVVAFIVGVRYEQGQQAEIRRAVQAAQPAPAQPSK
jgi:hypothetical protein